MEQQYDMEMTEDRKEKVKEILQTLFEDQYGCKLIRSSLKKEEISP